MHCLHNESPFPIRGCIYLLFNRKLLKETGLAEFQERWKVYFSPGKSQILFTKLNFSGVAKCILSNSRGDDGDGGGSSGCQGNMDLYLEITINVWQQHFS